MKMSLSQTTHKKLPSLMSQLVAGAFVLMGTIAQAQLSAPVQLNTNSIARPSFTNLSTNRWDTRYGPSVGIDNAGNSNIAWAPWVIIPTAPYNVSELWSAAVSATGALQTGQIVPGSTPTGLGADSVQIRTDAAGNSTAVWNQAIASTTVPGTIERRVLMAADKPAGGNWGTPVQIPTTSTAPSSLLSMNSRGDALLAIRDLQTVTYSRRLAGTSWTAPALLASMTDVAVGIKGVRPTQVIMGENGDSLVAWEGTGTYCVRSACIETSVEGHLAQMPSGATTWVQSPSGFGQFLLDKQGRTGLISTASVTNGTTQTYVVRSATQLGVGQPWSAPVDIFSAVTAITGIRAGNDDAGNIVAVFSDNSTSTFSATGSLATNAWSAPQPIVGFGPLTSTFNTTTFSVGTGGTAVLATRDVAVIKPSAAAPWGGVARLAPAGLSYTQIGVEASSVNASGKVSIVYWKLDPAVSTYRLYSVTGTNTGAPQGPVLPAAPTGLTASFDPNSPYTYGQINVNWIDNAGSTATTQTLERCVGVGCSSYLVLATLAPGVTTYPDTQLASATSYTYRVRASNSSGNSAYSNTASAVTKAVATPPVAPAGLSSTSVTRSSAALFWADKSNNEDSFSIERCKGAGCTSFAVVGTVGANVTSFTNSGLRSNTSYSYRVRATNATGTSAYSNMLTVKTLP